jgi:hypothetical protein
VAKLTILTHKIAIQLHLVAESCAICSSRSRRPVPKLLDTPSYMVVSRHRNVEQNHSLLIVNKCFEYVTQLKYFVMTVRYQNCIHEEIKSGLNSGNPCYHCIQILLSSRLLSKNLKIKVYRTITVVLYGCETGSLTLS